MVNTAEADIISPTVAAEYPNGLFGEVFLMIKNILAECAIGIFLFKNSGKSL